MSPKLFLTRANRKDYSSIRRLYTLPTKGLFGPGLGPSGDEGSFFRKYITHRYLLREHEWSTMLIGYAEFTTYPRIYPLPREHWLDWLKHLYCMDLPLSMTNVMFFDVFLYARNMKDEVLKAVLMEVFLAETRLKYVLTVEPPEFEPSHKDDITSYEILWKYSKIYYPRVYSVKTCANTQRIHVIRRDQILPKIRFRKAVPEDNDDLVELIDVDYPRMRSALGDYFIAEELLQMKKFSTIVVAEVNHFTIGFFWVNCNVDIVSLVKNFLIEPFGNLIKFDARKPYREQCIYVTLTNENATDKLFTEAVVKKMYEEAVETFGLKGELSAYTLSSAYKMDLVSDSESDEDSSSRSIKLNELEQLFIKFQRINEGLKTTTHYMFMHGKLLNFRYNIPENADPTFPIDAYPNVFALQLFVLNLEENDVRLMFNFLATAFSAYPDREYCLLAIPPAMPWTPCLHELLNFFIRIEPRAGGQIDDNLYLTHRSSVFGDVSLHNIRYEDIPDIEYMLYHGIKDWHNVHCEEMSQCSTHYSEGDEDPPGLRSKITSPEKPWADREMKVVRQVMNDVFDNIFTEFRFLTIRCGNPNKPLDETICVGFIILRDFPLLHCLDKHFNMPYLDEGRYCEIILLKLHPLMRHATGQLMRNLAHQTGYSHFFYFLPVKNHLRPQLSNDLVSSMSPIEPHRFKKVYYKKLTIHPQDSTKVPAVPPLNILEGNYALFMHNVLPSAFYGNKDSLVILGYTEVAKAFLRSLIFSWNTPDSKYIGMNCCVPRLNIVCIVKPGIVLADYDRNFTCSHCETQRDCWVNFSNRSAYVRDVSKRLDLRKYVHFVAARVRVINRQKKVVVLRNACEIPYDRLLIFWDNEFGLPKSLHPSAELPPNYAHINSRLDKMIFYHKLRARLFEFKEKKELRILIYGAHLRAYEFINFLITHGVEPSSITLAVPPRASEPALVLNIGTEDKEVENALFTHCWDMGITVYEHLAYAYWVRYYDDSSLSDVVFNSTRNDKQFVLACDFFISYCEYYIDMRITEVLRNSELSMNGRNLLVNENYQTIDPNIYAMGKFIEQDAPNHQYTHVSPREYAEKLMHVLGLHVVEYTKASEKFQYPTFFRCQVPSGYHLVKVTIPKRYLANHLNNDYTCPMVTCHEGDFTRVHLNEHNIVETIVCITKGRRHLDFLQYFCGKHEALLNNLKVRFHSKEIKNFIDFFQEPWTELLMNNFFSDLREATWQTSLSTAMKFSTLNVQRSIRKEHMLIYSDHKGVTRQMETVLLEFLRLHRSEFHHPFALPEDFIDDRTQYTN